MTALRRWYWQRIRRYDGEICHDCGLPVARGTASFWRATDGVWDRVVKRIDIVLCPRCFTLRAAARGIHIWWKASLLSQRSEDPR